MAGLDDVAEAAGCIIMPPTMPPDGDGDGDEDLLCIEEAIDEEDFGRLGGGGGGGALRIRCCSILGSCGCDLGGAGAGGMPDGEEC